MNDEAIIQHVLAELRAEFGDDLLGVLATGSRIRGEGDANSDIDLHVVIAQPRRQRRNVVVAGVEVEMFLNPPCQIRRYFKDGRASGRGVDQHMWSTGRVVYDPRGVLAELQAEAQAQWKAGPPPLPPEQLWMYRYAAADMLRDIGDVLHSDPERAVYLIGAEIPQVVDDYYRIAGRWRVKRKRVLNDLATWDAHAATLARQACAGAPDERYHALHALVEHCLAALGGPMPLVWQNEWEELSP